MWINAALIAEVEKAARVFYIGREQAASWNAHRQEGEPRLMSGWCWSSRAGREEQHGLKTPTACYIDAWYRLIAKAEPPRLRGRTPLRVATDRRIA